MSNNNEVQIGAVVTPIKGRVIDSYDDVPGVLRAARRSSGLTAAELARRVGRAASLISLRENGNRVAPTDDLIDTLAQLGKKLVVVDAAVVDAAHPPVGDAQAA